MRFKHTRSEEEFNDALHPIVHGMVRDLDQWLQVHGWPEAVVTCVLRTPEENRDLYAPQGKRVLRSTLEEKPPLSREEQGWVRAIRTAGSVDKWAREKPSLHLDGCACDVRNYLYTPRQRKLIHTWLKRHVAGSSEHPWELIDHDTGSGQHFHIGLNDKEWRDSFHPPTVVRPA